MPNPILCAIDTPDIHHAQKLAAQVQPYVGGIKLGLEFFVAHGLEGVKRVAECGAPLFLDLKFHDIPNTVAGAVRSLGSLNCFMFTLHTSGGKAMMQAAKEAALSLPHQPKVIGVTVLTSFSGEDLNECGVADSPKTQVERLAKLAESSGLDGIVCSPQELHAVRAVTSAGFTLVTPGIRPAGAALGDQKRVLTPAEALQTGSNYLVIGRPITGHNNPAAAAEEIAQSLTP